MKETISELALEGNEKILKFVIDKIEFTDAELELMKNKIIELAEQGNEKLLCLMLDKMVPDA